MAFFDTEDDVGLLHPIAQQADPSDYATRAERDVLGAYKQWNGLTWSVRLQGYDDSLAVINAELLLALKDTIADVISYRVLESMRGVESQGAKREKLGDYEIEYGTTPAVNATTSGFPPNWQYRLTKFDIRDLWFC